MRFEYFEKIALIIVTLIFWFVFLFHVFLLFKKYTLQETYSSCLEHSIPVNTCKEITGVK